MYIALRNITPGKRFAFAGHEWRVLEQQLSKTLEKKPDKTLVIKDKILIQRAFDPDFTQDWNFCELRAYLNTGFIQYINLHLDSKLGQTIEQILPAEVEFQPEDNLDDSRKSLDRVFLITAQQYRKMQKHLQKINNPWWTVTPATANHGFNEMMVVNRLGDLGRYSVANRRIGVRPALLLDADMMVKTIENKAAKKRRGAGANAD